MRFIDSASRPIRRVQEATEQMADKTSKMSAQVKAANTALIAFAAGADVAIGLTVAAAAQLEDSLARLETVTHATTKTVDTALKDAAVAARRFSEEFTASSNEIIKAQFQLATAGVPVEEQIEATQAAFKLSEATMGDFTNAAQLLGSFLNTFGRSLEFSYLEPAAKMEAITDRLSIAVQRFQVTLPVLAESFKFIVGPASQLNLKLSETAAAIGVLNTAGFRGTLAGTALSNMFNKLDRAVDKLNLNPEKFIDLNGNLRDLVSFLEEVNRSLADKTPIEAQNKLIETFDIRAGRVAKTLLNNIDAIKKFTAAMEVGKGATERMAQTMQSTTNAELRQMVNAFVNLAINIGNAFLPVVGVLADVLKFLAQSINSVIDVTGAWLPAIFAIGAVITTVSVGVQVLTLAVHRLNQALAATAAASTAASIALKALQSATVIGLVLTAIATIATYAGTIISGIGSLFEWLGDHVAGRTADKLRSIEKSFAGVSVQASRAAQEVERLASIMDSGIQSAFVGDDFGDLPVTNHIEQLIKEGVRLDLATKEAIKSAGGFLGISEQIGKSVGVSRDHVRALARGFLELRSSTDRTFDKLSESAKSAEFARSLVDGFRISLTQMAGGSQEGAQALGVLADHVRQLFEGLGRFGGSRKEKLLLSAFETLKNNVESFRTSDFKPLQDAVALFDRAKFRGEDLTPDSEEFKKIINQLGTLNFSLSDSLRVSQRFAEMFVGVSTAMQQANRSVSAVPNILKAATLAAGDLPKAFEETGNRIADGRKSFSAFIEEVKRAKDNIESLQKEFGKTAEFQELKKIIDSEHQIVAEMLLKFEDAEVERQGFKILSIISERFGRLPAAVAKDIEKIGNAFTSVLGGVLSGEVQAQGKSAFQELARSFRNEFMNRVIADLQNLLAPEFAFAMRKATDAARAVLEASFKGGVLFEELETGALTRKINEAVSAAAPELDRLFGGNALQFDKLTKIQEEFKKIGVDIGVGLVTAGNSSAALLRRLQGVLSEGPAKSLEGLNNQADQLRKLLRDASNVGADAAIRPIEGALRAVLEQLSQGGPTQVARTIAQESARASQSMREAGGAFAAAVGTVPAIAYQFVRIIEDGINRIKGLPIAGEAEKASAAIKAASQSAQNVASAIPEKIGEIDVKNMIQILHEGIKALPRVVDPSDAAKYTNALQVLLKSIPTLLGEGDAKKYTQMLQEGLNAIPNLFGSVDAQKYAQALQSNLTSIPALNSDADAKLYVQSLRDGLRALPNPIDENVAKAFVQSLQQSLNSLPSVINSPDAQKALQVIQQGLQTAPSLLKDTDALRFVRIVTDGLANIRIDNVAAQIVSSIVSGFNQINDLGIADGIKLASQELLTSSQRLAEVIATIPEAGRSFVSIIAEGLSKVQDLGTASISLEDTPKALEIRFDTGIKRFQIDISKDSTGIDAGDGLTEQEIRSILERVRDELRQENEEALRRIEDELRKR